MKYLIKPGRMLAFFLMLAMLIVVFVTTLYKLQIIEGAAYYEQSQNNVVTATTVAATRGDILDRYGRLLVSNRSCSNIVINTNALFAQDDPNAIILELVRNVKNCGDTYADELPITAQAPFEFVENMTDMDRTRLDAFLADKGWDKDITAVELMAKFRTRYEIDNSCSSEEMRIIAGIRYALNMHVVVNTSDYIFVEDASISLITSLMENNVPGFEVKTSYVREYNTRYASQILGYIGMMNEYETKEYSSLGYPLNAYVGKDGCEQTFEEYLHGTDGSANIISSASGTVLKTIYTQEPEPGNHVYLTLDIGLQAVAESVLGTYIEQENVSRKAHNESLEAAGTQKGLLDEITGGAVAVLSVQTGEPLTLASYPTFDLSTFMENYSQLNEDSRGPMVPRAIQGLYAPGSTFKPCTALAALCEEVISVETIIHDNVVFDKYADAGYAPRCWIYGLGDHGNLNVIGALQVSCNYFFYTIGDYMKMDTIAGYGYKLGLGADTGSGLHEALGVMATPEYKENTTGVPWYAGDTLQAGIGQSYHAFTPIQIATYISTLANYGTRYSTSILKSVSSYDYTETLYERQPEVVETIDANTAYYDAIRDGMIAGANTSAGTSYSTFGSYDVTVAAKTGTAQKGENVTNDGVFVCYAPAYEPEIAIVVAIEHGGSGSEIATIARDVLDYYFSFTRNYSAVERESTILK